MLERFPGNPILRPSPIPSWMTKVVRNPGVVHFGGRFHMVFTAHDASEPKPILRLGYATSDDGERWDVRPEPLLEPSDDPHDFDHGSVEDARATVVGDEVYVSYAARSAWPGRTSVEDRVPFNPNDRGTWTRQLRRTGLFRTRDFQRLEKLGPVSSEDDSDANFILFPRRVGGRYLALHRPSPFIPGVDQCRQNRDFRFAIRLLESDDLMSWSNSRVVAESERPWEDQKLGGAGVPIETQEGWLTLYHAVTFNERTMLREYRVGLMLLDLDDPTRVLARTPEPVMEPEEPWEREGDVPMVVFPSANPVVGGVVHVFYGGADTVIGLARAPLDRLLAEVLRHRIA